MDPQWPDGVTLVTIRHRPVTTGGRTLAGNMVTAVASERLWTDDGSILPAEASTTIAADGSWEITLPAVDVGLRPSGAAYRLTEHVPGAQDRSVWVAPMSHHAPGPVDLVDVLTPQPAPGGGITIQTGPATDPSMTEIANNPDSQFRASLTGTIVTVAEDAATDYLASEPGVADAAAQAATIGVAQAIADEGGVVDPTIATAITTPGSATHAVVAPRGELVVSVTDYAHLVVGSDWTPAFRAALTAVPAGGVLYIPPGTYGLATWTAWVQERPIIIRGAGRYSTVVVGPSRNVDFISARSDVHLSGIETHTWRYLVVSAFADAPVDVLSLADSNIHDVDRVLSASGTAASRIETTIVERNHIHSVSDAGFFTRYSGQLVKFVDNEFEDITRYIFRNIDTDLPEDLTTVRFERNQVSGVHAGPFLGALGAARVLQVSCVDLLITGNSFVDIRATGGPHNPDNTGATGNTNIAYMGVRHAEISGNVHHLCESNATGTAGLYHFKSPASSATIRGNQFNGTGTTGRVEAIVLDGDNLTVEGNTFNDYCGSAVYCSWTGVRTARIAGNLIKNNKAEPFVVLGAYKDIVIESNIVDGVEFYGGSWWGFTKAAAVYVARSNAATFGSHLTVANNAFRHVVADDGAGTVGNSSAIYIQLLPGYVLDGVSVHGNTLEDANNLIHARATQPSSELRGLQVYDNDLADVPTPLLIEAGVQTMTVTRFRDNIGITEQPPNRG